MVDGYCSWGGTKQKQIKVDMENGLERERERECNYEMENEQWWSLYGKVENWKKKNAM
jgi:hypothetical protein